MERFEEKIALIPFHTCWEWIGAQGTWKYGWFHLFGNKKVYAHRFAYEHYIGPIPNDKIVLHRCDNTTCVNPNHLFLGTPKDNTEDCVKKGRAWWQKSA